MFQLTFYLNFMGHLTFWTTSFLKISLNFLDIILLINLAVLFLLSLLCFVLKYWFLWWSFSQPLVLLFYIFFLGSLIYARDFGHRLFPIIFNISSKLQAYIFNVFLLYIPKVHKNNSSKAELISSPSSNTYLHLTFREFPPFLIAETCTFEAQVLWVRNLGSILISSFYFASTLPIN